MVIPEKARRVRVAAIALAALCVSSAASRADPPPLDAGGISGSDDKVPDADPKTLLDAVGPLGDMSYGSKDASVVVVEYSSLTCVFCAAFHNAEFPSIEKEYVKTGKVRWVLREFVGDRVAMAATRMARCAAKSPSEAFLYETGLFRRQTDFTTPIRVGQAAHSFVLDPMAALYRLSTTYGVDPVKLAACRKDATVAKALADQAATATARFHVGGTPTFFVNGKAVLGDPGKEGFDALIAAAAKAAR